eukprot:3518516-Rhodomonas_salina.1
MACSSSPKPCSSHTPHVSSGYPGVGRRKWTEGLVCGAWRKGAVKGRFTGKWRKRYRTASEDRGGWRKRAVRGGSQEGKGRGSVRM